MGRRDGDSQPGRGQHRGGRSEGNRKKVPAGHVSPRRQQTAAAECLDQTLIELHRHDEGCQRADQRGQVGEAQRRARLGHPASDQRSDALGVVVRAVRQRDEKNREDQDPGHGAAPS